MSEIKVEPPSIAKRNASISVLVAIIFLILSLAIAMVTPWETRQAVIGGEEVTGKSMILGAFVMAFFGLGVTILAFTFLFWIGWKHDYNQLLKQRQK